MRGVENVRRVLSLADRIDQEEGLQAYTRYRVTLERFSDYYAVPLAGVVGAFVALSPNNDFAGNLRSLATLLWGFRKSIPVENLTVSTYGACKQRAWNYIQGIDFLSDAKGPKTRAFYQNILNPSDPEPVTIDGHMVGVWRGQRMTMKAAVTSGFNYNEIAQGIRNVAREVGLVPCQVQATCWFTWKRIHGVVYDPQLSLLRSADQWGSDVHPRDVRPFPLRPRWQPLQDAVHAGLNRDQPLPGAPVLAQPLFVEPVQCSIDGL